MFLYLSQNKRLYSLRKPKRNVILDRLQSEYEDKAEMLFLKPSTKSLLSTNDALTSTSSHITDVIRKSGLKQRGRPRKKPLETVNERVKMVENGKGVVRKERNWLKLKENVRESVYLTRPYSTNSFFKTVGFKVNSRLVGPIESFKSENPKALRFWSVHDVSQFVASIPGCEKFNQLFVSQVFLSYLLSS